MKLHEVKKSYDLIVSLGMSCAPAINLRRNNLRKFAMPLDWMISFSLSDVSRLYRNKFQNFMEFENLSMLEETHFLLDDGAPIYPERKENTPVKSYFIKDTQYNIISVHDFPIIEGSDWTSSYSSYKAKLNSRISRFWDRLTKSQSTLFVRWASHYEQAVELQSVLSQCLQKNSFTVLILNPVPDLQYVREINWDINNVCVLEVPEDMNDYDSWDSILKDIQLNED
ncbi:DUF1796 family putative cysteine peptidase [Paenibacillus sp. NPDC057934]|uniref:DUF1796 family putative cysteine peptidase n=1 Tax=Paenibacillus sp. NPDC057934 TaxID=3346282 RepID=UPI0036DC8708